MEQNDQDRMELLRQVDVLVDGMFLMAEKSLELDYRGSKNQRLIDVPASLRENKVALWTPPVW